MANTLASGGIGNERDQNEKNKPERGFGSKPEMGIYRIYIDFYKGHLISKCLFGVIVWTKKTMKIL